MRFQLLSLSLMCLIGWSGGLRAQGADAHSPATRAAAAERSTPAWNDAARYLAAQRDATPANALAQTAQMPAGNAVAAGPQRADMPNPAAPMIPLKPPSHGEHGRPGATPSGSGLQPLLALGGSLAVVLGVFFLLAWMMRKTAPPGLAVLPNEAFEVLGRAALAGRQQAQLLRCGGKLLLVAMTPTGAQTLTEITDPEEVDRLCDLCHRSRASGASTAFRRVFNQLSARQQTPDKLPLHETAGVVPPPSASDDSDPGASHG